MYWHVTPKGSCQRYGGIRYEKQLPHMEWKYDQQYNVVSGPARLYYGSDQYSACNNLAIAKGRDLAWLDCEKYNQICVLGAQAAQGLLRQRQPCGTDA